MDDLSERRKDMRPLNRYERAAEIAMQRQLEREYRDPIEPGSFDAKALAEKLKRR